MLMFSILNSEAISTNPVVRIIDYKKARTNKEGILLVIRRPKESSMRFSRLLGNDWLVTNEARYRAFCLLTDKNPSLHRTFMAYLDTYYPTYSGH